MDKNSGPLGAKKRPQYLLSGLLVCGQCLGGYSNIIQAIKDGVPAELIKDELEQISGGQDELKKLVETESHEVRPLIHPAMALRYRTAEIIKRRTS